MANPVDDVLKDKILKLIVLVLVICFCSGCAGNGQKIKKQLLTKSVDSTYRKIDFEKFIIEQKDDSLDFYEELLANRPFVDILEHSKSYFPDVLSFLNRGNFNTGQVAISICAMQNLNVHDYVKLCNTILYLYNAKKLPVTILDHAIAPDFLRKRIIIDNYTNPEVIALIKNIQSNKTPADSDLLKWLPDVLSGKSSKDLREFDQENASN
jgi:hypothetical protein